MLSKFDQMSSEQQDRYATISLYAVVVIWGGTFLLQKMLLTTNITVFYLIGLRFTCISVLFFKYNPLKFRRSTWTKGMITGAILFIAFAFQNFGIISIDVSVAAFLTGLTAVFVPIINHIIFRQGFTIYNTIAVVLALIGTYFFNLTANMEFQLSIGSIFCTIGAMFFAIHVICNSHFLKDEDPAEFTVVQGVTCAILGYLCAFLFSEPFPTEWTPFSIFGLLYLGLFGSVLCYFLQTLSQKYIKNVVKVGLILILEPVFATLVAIPFGENITLFKIIGMIVIFSGVILSEMQDYIMIKKAKLSQK